MKRFQGIRHGSLLERAMQLEDAAEQGAWTPEKRLEIARRHLMKAAREWERIPEAHQALMIAVDQIDHAEKSAK